MNKLATVIAVVGLIGTPAFAADIAVKAPSPAPAELVTYNWAGFYAGGNVGWMWSTAQTTAAVPGLASFAIPMDGFSANATSPALATVDSTDPNGVIGGVQFGYDWKGASNWIAGVETDIQASGQSATNAASATNVSIPFGIGGIGISVLSHIDAIDWFGNVRGGPGYAIWPGMMVYGRGGLAYGRVSTSAVATQTASFCPPTPCAPPTTLTTSNGDGSAIKTGWTAGGGIARVVPNNAYLTWKVEYPQVDLGSINSSFVAPTSFKDGAASGVVSRSGSVSSKFTDNIVRFGADYHF
jgi:outer membrane immunogenic protein